MEKRASTDRARHRLPQVCGEEEVKYTKEQQEWIDSRPENVRAVIKTHPPIGCYRGYNGRGHYVLYSYDEEKSGKVTLKVNHLDDSFMPGFQVFGVDPESLTYCGCLEPLKRKRREGRG